MKLFPEEIPENMVSSVCIFHFGTLSLTHGPVFSATQKALALAKDTRAIISFYPNLRPTLWSSLEDAKGQIASSLAQCDISKIADNEIEFMISETDLDKGAAYLVTTKKGTIRSLPEQEQIQVIL